MANLDVLQGAVQFITDHPEKHQQHLWTCNTGACLAGHITLLNGHSVHTARSPLNGLTYVVNGSVIEDETGEVTDVRTTAIRLADLSSKEADILFDGYNTREDIELMVKDIANGEDLDRLWRAETRDEDNGIPEGRIHGKYYRDGGDEQRTED